VMATVILAQELSLWAGGAALAATAAYAVVTVIRARGADDPAPGFLALPVSECVDAFVELAGMDQGPQDVVGQIPGAQGDAAQVLEASIDRFDGPVRQVGVEVGEDLVPSFP